MKCFGPLWFGDGDACGSCAACDAYADAGTLCDYLVEQCGRSELRDPDAREMWTGLLAEWLCTGEWPDELAGEREDLELAREQCWPTWYAREDAEQAAT